VFEIENAAARLWKSLKSFRHEWPVETAIYTELTALIDSLYGPKIPAKEITIPENDYISQSTMQALARSKRSDFRISAKPT
jgi:hypothetical protein